MDQSRESGPDTADTLATQAGDDGAPDASPGDPAILDAGARLGRYVVLERIGAGAMGVVYAAFDPQLDRKVAIKLVAARRRGSKAAAARMLREAKALAKLSHPNVVAIHDVGLHHGAVFVAMEHVSGTTLREWFETRQRSWREVLSVMIPAARGLCAVHESGLVHRDFKPDNVMVDTSGRVRVMDFGLAHAERDPTDAARRIDSIEEMRSVDEENLKISLRDRLTRTGATKGTPAYMAPEQHRGLPVTPSSDQFAFCVVLYEGLFGAHPFRSASATQMAVAVLEGKVTPPPKNSGVPQWLRRVAFRGLEAQWEQRFASMDTLIAALEQGLGRRRRGSILGAAGITVLGAGLAVALASRPEEDACPDGHGRLAPAWDDDARTRVREGLTAVDLPASDAIATSVARGLDDYADGWAALYSESCRAHRTLRELSEDDWSRRVQCLDARRRSLSALVDVLSDANADVVQHAADAVTRLPSVNTCADLEALRIRGPQLAPEESRDDVVAFEERLARARALQATGDLRRATELANALVTEAEGLEHPRSLVAALLVVSRVYAEQTRADPAIEAVQRALLLSVEHGLEHQAAQAAIDSLRVVVSVGRRTQRVEERADFARAFAKAVDDPELSAEFALAYGRALLAAGRLGDATRQLEIARASLAALHGERSRPVAEATLALADLASLDGRHDDAFALHDAAAGLYASLYPDFDPFELKLIRSRASMAWQARRNEESARLFAAARALAEERYGPRDGAVALAILGQARLARRAGEPARALELTEEAIDLLEDAPPLELAQALTVKGAALGTLGRLAEAERAFVEALALRRATLGATHPDLGIVLNNLGYTAYLDERLDDSRDYYEEGIEVQGGAYGEVHVRLETLRTNLGTTLLAQERWAEARLQFELVLDARRRLSAQEEISDVQALQGLGLALRGEGREPEARDAFERAVGLLGETRNARAGAVRLELASLLEAEDPERARALASRVLADDGPDSDNAAQAQTLLTRLESAP